MKKTGASKPTSKESDDKAQSFPMKQVPYEDRKDYWKFVNAAVAFEQVEDLLEFFAKEKIDETHPLFYQLMTSLVVLYGRPFKQRKALRLLEALIPDGLKDTHDFLILLRDKMFAHLDLDGPSEGDNLCNKIIISAERTSFTTKLGYLRPRDLEFKKARSLAHILWTKANYHADKIWKRHMGNHPFAAGEYEVNLSKTDDSFLIPFRGLES
jgi:hypothetical protein